MRWNVTLDGVYIDDSIYCTRWYTTHDYTVQVAVTHARTHTHTRLHCRFWVAACNGGRSFLCVPVLSSALSLSSSRTAQKTPFLCLCCVRSHRLGPRRKRHSSVAIYGPLVRNGRCLAVCFAVVAQQWVCMPQLFDWDKLYETRFGNV
jgi:hypothetical protein